MGETKRLRLHAFVKGRVQGVSFRYFTLQAAKKYGLAGWVRNLWDGRVEVMAEGNLDDLNRLLIDLRQGPGSANVEDIDYDITDSRDTFTAFRVRMNA